VISGAPAVITLLYPDFPDERVRAAILCGSVTTVVRRTTVERRTSQFFLLLVLEGLVMFINFKNYCRANLYMV
jgi:hypothetical protein